MSWDSWTLFLLLGLAWGVPALLLAGRGRSPWLLLGFALFLGLVGVLLNNAIAWLGTGLMAVFSAAAWGGGVAIALRARGRGEGRPGG